MIDLHTHILPGMDDGSKSPEISRIMLQRMAAQGVTHVCATSHYYVTQNDIPTFCARRARALERLGDLTSLPQLILGAEVAYYTGITDTPELQALCLAGTRTLLLEMPYGEWTSYQVSEARSLSLDLGYQVVLVHPERFCSSKNNRRLLEKLSDFPLQINAASLLHWQTRRTALSLLQTTPLPLLGSDCHNLDHRPPNLWDGRAVVARKLGEEFLAQLDSNAAQVALAQVHTV